MTELFPHLFSSTFTLWLLVWIVCLFVLAYGTLFTVYRFEFKTALSSKVGNILLGWAIIIPIYFLGIFAKMELGMVLVGVVLFWALREVISLCKLPSVYRYSIYLLLLITLVIATYFPQHYLSLPLVYFLIITALPIRMNDIEFGLTRISQALLILIWIVFFGGHIILLGHLDFSFALDRALLGGIILAVSLSDIGAFVSGKLLHRLPLAQKTLIAPAITPNKHWLGLIGHIGGAAIGLAIASPFLLDALGWWDLSILALVIGFIGLLGGLMNSLMKRTFGVKDSGELIPGHGGVLDRIDSLVRVAGASYYVLLILL